MRRIFHGFMFVFLDFNLNLGASSIDLIPDFIGYIMIALAVMIAWLVSFSKTANLYEENMTRIRTKLKENQQRPAAK